MPDVQLLFHSALFFISFILIWVGSGLIISEVSLLARSLKVSFFTISFFLLGLLTSLPEFSIGISSTINQDPQIFVGNLIGGSLSLFMLVIPLLAITGGKINYPSKLNIYHLICSLGLIVAPAFFLFDDQVTITEGLLLIFSYLGLFLAFVQNEGLWEKVNKGLTKKTQQTSFAFFKIIGGLILLIIASQQIVKSTEYYAVLFNFSPFLVGLLLVSLGTNLPELGLVARSIIEKNKEVALADYIGSASANSLLFGIFTLLNGKTITVPNHSIQRFLFLAAGLILFYFFARSKSSLSRLEGVFLLIMYVVFVLMELSRVEL